VTRRMPTKKWRRRERVEEEKTGKKFVGIFTHTQP